MKIKKITAILIGLTMIISLVVGGSGVCAAAATDTAGTTAAATDTAGTTAAATDTTQATAETTAGGDQEATVSAQSSSTKLGGWKINPKSRNIKKNSKARKAFKKATSKLEGYNYKVISYLGSQTVQGTNYAYLCLGTPVVPKAKSEYVIVYVYKDLKGHCSVSKVTDVDLDATADEDDSAN